MHLCSRRYPSRNRRYYYYDLIWTRGILQDLREAGVKGRLASYIERFLDNSEFRVKVGSSLSYTKLQATGVPQGSTLSVTLFGLKINSNLKNQEQ